jgi:hypothetical protein
VVQRFHELVQGEEETKAAQPHKQRLLRGHVRHVKVQTLLGRHAVVPNQLVLLGQGACGEGQPLKGGL